MFSKPTCSLPLLQVWPSQVSYSKFLIAIFYKILSQDSPRGEADGQSFIFPILHDDRQNELTCDRRNTLYIDPQQTGDSGIDSIQASPSPNAFVTISGVSSGINISPCTSPPNESPTPSLTKPRRLSSALLHPDHARLLALRQQQLSPDQVECLVVITFVHILSELFCCCRHPLRTLLNLMEVVHVAFKFVQRVQVPRLH